MREECIKCGAELPLLNSVEENDFVYLCEDCIAKEDEEERKEIQFEIDRAQGRI